MRDVLRFAAGAAEAEPLHRLGEDDRRLARVLHGRLVGVEDLARVVSAAVQVPDVLVGQVGDHFLQLRILAEEILARIRAALGLEVLVLAVDAFHHQPAQQALGVLLQQRIPARTPHHLDDVPARAEERGFEFLDDLAVAAHRPVETLQVAVDDEHEVVELLAHRHRDRAERLRLVHLAVAEEGPDLAIAHRHDAAMLEVAHEARLVDRHHRAEAHRHRRELPEVRHQPRMGIRGQSAAHFLTEAVQLVFAEAAFEVRARIDAGRRVALDEDHVAGMLLARGTPEVIEADFVQRRRRGITRQVPAEFRALPVGMHDHGHRVPAQIGLDAAFERAIARIFEFLPGRNGVDVGRVRLERQVRTGTAREIDDALEQVVCPLGSLRLQHGIDGFQPFARFGGIGVVDLGRFEHQSRSPSVSKTRRRPLGGNDLPGTAC